MARATGESTINEACRCSRLTRPWRSSTLSPGLPAGDGAEETTEIQLRGGVSDLAIGPTKGPNQASTACAMTGMLTVNCGTTTDAASKIRSGGLPSNSCWSF
jgi:hypothetical protein